MLTNSPKSITKGRLIPHLKLSGPKQMALDILLLRNCSQTHKLIPSIRFYSWDGPWLSIGKNQQLFSNNLKRLVEEGNLQIVRRPSGGGAVLHSGGLTYSFIWPSAPRKKREAYLHASKWLMKGFSDLGLPLQFGTQRYEIQQENCFTRSTSADLVDTNGIKRIGSAQFWNQGNLLQHGEILLDPPKQLWSDIFQSSTPQPAPGFIPRKGLDKFLISNLKLYWPEIDWQWDEVTEEEFKSIEKETSIYSFTF